MAFDGPQTADYENVLSLNKAYLGVLRRDSRSHYGLAHMTPELFGVITELPERQIDRLASAPFLLLSFREHDERYWDTVLATDRDRDLFSRSGSEDIDTLISAGLGFVWQLARDNPYAVRLFCGASLYWCERIAEQTFYQLLSSVMARGGVPVLRHAHDRGLWSKLLDSGINVQGRIRGAAQMSAMQTILTRPDCQRQQVFARAARSAGGHELRVADRSRK